MTKKDSLGDRMKSSYEDRFRYKFARRSYTLLRIDGRSHHSYTKGLEKPYCKKYMNAMQETALYICKNLPGAEFAYMQSDEITILLTDFKNDNTEMVFDGNIQKTVSVVASMAAAYFNQESVRPQKDKLASFDCRGFQIADYVEIYNNFYWRMQDAERNSLQMLCQANFKQRELNGANKERQHELLHSKGINWANEPTQFKRGSMVRRGEDGGWFIDKEIPVFGRDKEWLQNMIPRIRVD